MKMKCEICKREIRALSFLELGEEKFVHYHCWIALTSEERRALIDRLFPPTIEQLPFRREAHSTYI
jgi:hypothetical protein